MFSLDNYWEIFEYLKDVRSDETNSTSLADTSNPDVDDRVKTLARSERTVVESLFSNNLDQVCFDSKDYQRLKNLLVDWYTTHRTITSTQRYCSDLYRMPEEHLNELFRSFGIDIGLDTKTVPYFENKVALFLDLVNLYKKKGTPEALQTILEYYGFRGASVIEYWLVKNAADELIFRGQDAMNVVTEDIAELSFDEMTEDDPHWMITEDQINSAISRNKISLPTKTPYFSLTSKISLQDLTALMSIISRAAKEEYTIWDATGELPDTVTVGNFTFGKIPVEKLLDRSQTVHILELYLGIIYCLEKISET